MSKSVANCQSILFNLHIAGFIQLLLAVNSSSAVNLLMSMKVFLFKNDKKVVELAFLPFLV